MERRGGAQTIVAAVRGLGSDGLGVGCCAAQAVGDLVLTASRRPKRPKNETRAMKLNRTFAGPAEMPATIPLFPLTGALLLPRRPIRRRNSIRSVALAASYNMRRSATAAVS